MICEKIASVSCGPTHSFLFVFLPLLSPIFILIRNLNSLHNLTHSSPFITHHPRLSLSLTASPLPLNSSSQTTPHLHHSPFSLQADRKWDCVCFYPSHRQIKRYFAFFYPSNPRRHRLFFFFKDEWSINEVEAVTANHRPLRLFCHCPRWLALMEEMVLSRVCNFLIHFCSNSLEYNFLNLHSILFSPNIFRFLIVCFMLSMLEFDGSEMNIVCSYLL